MDKVILVCGKTHYTEEDITRVLKAGLKGSEAADNLRNSLSSLSPEEFAHVCAIDWENQHRDKVMEDNGFKK